MQKVGHCWWSELKLHVCEAEKLEQQVWDDRGWGKACLPKRGRWHKQDVNSKRTPALTKLLLWSGYGCFYYWYSNVGCVEKQSRCWDQTPWPHILRCIHCKPVNNQGNILDRSHPPATTDARDLNTRLPAPGGILKASSDVSGTFGLFYDAHVCASTSWPTFIVFQPICSLFSALSKHKRSANVTKRRRDASGHGEQRP